MGFRRAKFTQRNTNRQKNIFVDDRLRGHHPRALRFLYKIAHKISRLRKFNRARVIEFNFFIAWNIFMNLGTLFYHVHGYKNLAQIFFYFLPTELAMVIQVENMV